MRMIGVIPARGGSKGISGKNLALCGGRPLLTHTAEAALAADGLSRVLLSTDDPKIAEVGTSCGLEVPFLRPAELAQDETPMVEVLGHLLRWIDSNGESVDGLVLLQPTSPLRQKAHIEASMDIFARHAPATLVSVMAVPHQFSPPSLMVETDGFLQSAMDGEMMLRRQDKPRYLARNGPAILIANPEDIRCGLLYGERVIGYEMDAHSSLDVDSVDDLAEADRLIRAINLENE